jgi:hypothetical protein
LKSDLQDQENYEIVRLKSSLNLLSKKVDSLNSKIIELDEYQQNEIFSESSCLNSDNRSASEKELKIICPSCDGEGYKQETCKNCLGSGYRYNRRCYDCSWSDGNRGSGYENKTCSVCYGTGRINEYE